MAADPPRGPDRTMIDGSPPAPAPAPAARPARTEISAPPSIPIGTNLDRGRTAISAPPVMTAVPAPARAPVTGPTAPPATAPPPTASPSLSSSLTLGMRVEQFEIIRELGRGGMGQVFLARDTRLGRLVALKFLGVHSHDLVERFLVEARATAQCNHENIVVIYDADEWQGQPYMALEFLEGEPLGKLLERGPMTARRAIEIMTPVVRALVRAHELNIVHRDLKPDNIFVTESGVVKVLDFGIAKLFGADDAAPRVSAAQLRDLQRSSQTQHGGIVGTMPYMSPEQWGADVIDHKTDLWAVGIILWEMLTGRHPLEPLTAERLAQAAAMLDHPMPPIAQQRHDLPGELERIIDRCLVKRKAQRWGSARELLEALEQLDAGRYGRRLEEDESPYPGLSAFEEDDADRFFGRGRDVLQMVQRLREHALVGVVGPSGVGKSSFLRAGVVPALKASGEAWEVLIARPGRSPISSLATLLQPLTQSTSTDLQMKIAEHQQLVDRLRAEPGYLGTLLRSRARQKREQILLFVDQFEELYTQVADPAERRAFTACLAGVADDPSTPLRVVVSMRSDFLDRVAEDRIFLDRLTRGLSFLPPVDREGMREALIQPLEMVGVRFESPAVVDDMLDSLAATPGALPLLQFTAAKLWDARDRGRNLLTEASYRALGGVAGALATHADEVLAALPAERQRLARAVFQRLVTSDGTRATVDVAELRTLSDPGEVQALLDHLVHARLLVVQRRGDQEGPAVEIVHESLITRWPTLRRWLEESVEDSAFLEQLRAAARQWESRGRAVGMLWRGDAADEAGRFQRRFKGELASRERDFLGAVIELATRTVRRRRRIVIGAFVLMSALVAAAAVALVWIRSAEQAAQEQRDLARSEADRAREAEEQVRSQMAQISEQMDTIKRKETERLAATTQAVAAEEKAVEAEAKAKTGEAQLAMTYEQLESALEAAKKEKVRAEREAAKAEKAAAENQQLADSERAAKEKTEKLLAQEKARVKKLEEEKRKLSTTLK